MITKKDAVLCIKKNMREIFGFTPKTKDIRFLGSNEDQVVVDINGITYRVRYNIVVEKCAPNYETEADNPA